MLLRVAVTLYSKSVLLIVSAGNEDTPFGAAQGLSSRAYRAV